MLDLAHPTPAAYLLERLDALLTEYGIDYLKWDHNRDLLDAGTPAGRPAAGPACTPRRSPSTALLDELRARHPGLEIE